MHGTAERPRLNIFRSNKHLLLQAINDDTGLVVASVSDAGKASKVTGTKTEHAQALAKKLGEKLTKAKVGKLMIDRGSYKYHGRVKAVAEALREGGIEV